MPREKKRSRDDPSDSAAVAASLQSKRTSSITKRTYRSKINAMKEWLQRHHPDCIDSDTSELRVPLPKNVILAFFGHICSPAHACDRANMDARDASTPLLSVSFVWVYRSALVDVYHSKLIELEQPADTELRRVLDGYEKVINSLKKRGLMKINEGKSQLKTSGFDMLALKLMTITPVKRGQAWRTVLFGWGYFVLMWNLMSRSDSISTIMLQHIEWVDDCLTVEEQGHKGDQTGAEKYGKHVYANPYEPSRCPILALAVHLFCCPERLTGGKQQLFLGDDSKNRGRMLRRVIGSLGEDEISVLSCSPGDLGTHRLRKGSRSYALGQVNGPTPVSVYLRMGQSLGKLKDRYIHFGEGADQLCGRMIAGLPFNSEQFGVLPPHFPPVVTAQMTCEYWEKLVSGFGIYPRGIRSSFPYFLASVIHHEQFLRATLNSSHPNFAARIFSSNPLLNLQLGSTVISIGASPVCALKATGILAHLATAKEVTDLRQEVSDLTNEINQLKSDVSSVLPENVAAKVVTELRQHFAVNGVAPVSLRDISSLRSDLAAEFRSAISAIQHPYDPRAATSTDVQQPDWRSWNWNDGQLAHVVPKGWEFPARMSVKQMWNLCFFGNKDTGIRPYRLINKQHDTKVSDKMRHSRVRKVMEHVLCFAMRLSFSPSVLPEL